MNEELKSGQKIRGVKMARVKRNRDARKACFERYIYLLECEGGRFYVGKTNFLLRRMREHFINCDKGSLLTKTFRPLALLHFERIKCTDKQLSQHEKELAIRAAKTWGLMNVAGGGIESRNPNIQYREDQMEQVDKLNYEEFNGMSPAELSVFLSLEYSVENRKFRSMRREAIQQLNKLD